MNEATGSDAVRNAVMAFLVGLDTAVVQLNPFRQTLSGNSDWPGKVTLAQDDDFYRQRRPFAKVRCH